MQFPITFLEGNLIFNSRGEVWALYRLEPWHYEHLSDDERVSHLHRLARLLSGLEEYDGQLLLIPFPHRVREHFADLAAQASTNLVEQTRTYCETVANRLTEALPPESVDYAHYLCLKLPPAADAEKSDLREFLRRLVAEPKRFLEELAGVDSGIRTEAEVAAALEREEMLYQRIVPMVRARRVDAPETARLLRRSFMRGIAEPGAIPGWSHRMTATTGADGAMHLQPNRVSLLSLSEGELDLKNPRRVSITQVDGGSERTGHTTFCALSTVPDELTLPGSEWLYSLQNLPFPVEACLRWRSVRHQQVLAMVRRKRMDISDQGEHTHKSGEEIPIDLMEAHDQVHLLEHELKRRRFALLETSCLFAVAGSDPQRVMERVQRLREHFTGMQMSVDIPTGDQFQAFCDFLPGAPWTLTDYAHRLPPEAVAASMFLATRSLGDLSGPYIGRIGLLNKPVFLDPALPPRINRSASAAFLGTLGSGKSFAANLMAYLAVVARGARVLILDPKGERSAWAEALPELAGNLHIISLTPSPADDGKLDPFVSGRLLPPDEQKEVGNLALSLLSFLTGAATGDDKFLALMEAVERTKDSETPSMRGVVVELERMGRENPTAASLARYLQALSQQAYANLLFGNGTETGLDVSAPLTVLQLQRLTMPPAGKPADEYSLEELLSVALMHAVTAFATLFTRRDRDTFKAVLLDEAWSVLGSSQGKALVANLLRTGRAMNNGVYLITQNAADLLDETIRNNIGFKFVFRSHDQDEVARVLQLLNLEVNEDNVLAVRSLETGTALLQDLEGRVGVVQLDPVLTHLYHAFDTRPPHLVQAP